MSDTLRRLRGAPPEEFAATVEAALAATHERWSVEASPPSPADGFDAVLEREEGEGEGTTRLLHVRQYGPESAVDAPTVRDLAALRDRQDADGAALLTTGRVSATASEVAAAADVEVVAGEALAGLVRDAGIRPSEAEGGTSPDPVAVAERLAGYWPDRLGKRAAALVRAVDERGTFEHRVRRGTASTELEFLPGGGGTALVKVRFTETSLLVFVRDGEQYERVVALTVHRERPPGVSRLVSRVEDALDRVERGPD